MTAADARRRWFGLLFLVLAAGFLIWGRTVFQPYLKGVVYMLYWLACFAFTLTALAIALVDLRAIRRRQRQGHEELIRRTLDDLRPRAPKGLDARAPERHSDSR